ncbi:hypothetical protein BC830DRAFT_1130668 [Chytriomyces sp. MP71]|nr:hypothetical protein BC830DRAFT_1130668 [Chytriomyces sp. MP71]
MILARVFAQYLCDSDQVALVLAYWEHMLIPDECFFGTVQQTAHLTPRHAQAQSRKDLGKDERDSDPQHFFMRKVDHSLNETEPLLEWVSKYDRSYGMLDGLEFIPGYDALRRVRKIKKVEP